MKKTATVILSAALILTLSSCASGQDHALSAMTSKMNAYESTVSTLADKLMEIQQSQAAAKQESDKKLAELTEKLEKLENKTPGNSTGAPTQPETSDQGFKYIVSEGVASITGYDGDQKKIVIPASINGYRVTSIADGAFEGSKLTDVIISDGIEYIGWFAFGNCSALKSITIPSSVTSIGYGALGTAESAPFIYCHADSFALSYAKSYGLSYAVI